MGLAGRKQKQRIPDDPRNLTWADNAAKFGQAYLSKLGWDPSKGLGAEGDGRKSHIKVSQKLDMLGIGAAQSKDPNGIAWKQNQDFEKLLKRLNETPKPDSQCVQAEFAQDATEKKGSGEEEEEKEKKKKRKRERQASNEEDRKKVKKLRKSKAEGETEDEVAVQAPQRMAHRAKSIAARRLALRSDVAISEILGIAPSKSPTPATSTPSIGTLTPIEDVPSLEKLTTSVKSVSDYFKEKLLTKSTNKQSKMWTSAGQITDVVVNPSAISNDLSQESLATRPGIGSSRYPDTNRTEEETPRLGLGATSSFSSLLSNTFLSSLPTRAENSQSISDTITDVKPQTTWNDDEAPQPTTTAKDNADPVSVSLDGRQCKEDRKKAKAERKARKEETRSRRDA